MRIVWSIVLATLFLIGCAGAQTSPTFTPPPATATPTAAATAEPSPTPTETPTLTPTPAPQFLTFFNTAQPGDVLFVRIIIETIDRGMGSTRDVRYLQLWAIAPDGSNQRHLVNVQPQQQTTVGRPSPDGRYYAVSHGLQGVLLDLYAGEWSVLDEAINDATTAHAAVDKFLWEGDTLYYVRDEVTAGADSASTISQWHYAHVRQTVPGGTPEEYIETPLITYPLGAQPEEGRQAEAHFGPSFFAADGRYLISGGRGEGGGPGRGAWVWDRETDTVNTSLTDPATGQTILVWDVHSDQVLYSYTTLNDRIEAYNNGVFIATMGPGGVLVDRQTVFASPQPQMPVRQEDLNEKVCAGAVFTPDGGRVLCHYRTEPTGQWDIVQLEPVNGEWQMTTVLEPGESVYWLPSEGDPFLDDNRFFVINWNNDAYDRQPVVAIATLDGSAEPVLLGQGLAPVLLGGE